MFFEVLLAGVVDGMIDVVCSHVFLQNVDKGITSLAILHHQKDHCVYNFIKKFLLLLGFEVLTLFIDVSCFEERYFSIEISRHKDSDGG